MSIIIPHRRKAFRMGSPFTDILASNGLSAWSEARRLTDDWMANALIKIYNGSSSANIGWGADLLLDEAAALSHAPTTGKVEAVYDQLALFNWVATSGATGSEIISSSAVNKAFGNSRPASVAAGQRYKTSGSNFGSQTEIHFVGVVKMDNDPPLTAAGQILQAGTAATATHFPFTNSLVYCDIGSTTRRDAISSGTDLSNPFILSVRSSASLYEIRVNNSVIYTSGTNTVGLATGTSLNWRWDSRAGGGNGFRGRFPELMVFSPMLTSGELDAVQSNMASFWGGITLA